MSSISDRLVQVIEDWPSHDALTPENVASKFPDLEIDSHAEDAIVVENYIRELEGGNKVLPREFLSETANPSLVRRLQNVADLHRMTACDNTDRFPKVGDRILHYLLLEHLGRGAYSSVFLAADENAGDRRVVVKLTCASQQEGQILAVMNHESVPCLYAVEHDEATNLTVICTRYVGSRTLLDEINEVDNGNIDFGRSMQHMVQIAEALSFAHKQGIIHCDVKPANILIGDNDRAYLIDFNLSTPILNSSSVSYRGTASYAAPEILEGMTSPLLANPVSVRADIFSFGAVLYELLTGKAPWNCALDLSTEEYVDYRLNEPVVPPSQLNPKIGKALEEIILKALSLDQFQRQVSVDELLGELRSCISKDRNHSLIPSATLAFSVLAILFGLTFTQSLGTTDTETRLPIGNAATNALPIVPPSFEGNISQCIFVKRGWHYILNKNFPAAKTLLRKSESLERPRLLAYTHLQLNEFSTARRVMRESDLTDPKDCFVGALVEIELAVRLANAVDYQFFDQLLQHTPTRANQKCVEALIVHEATHFNTQHYHDRLLDFVNREGSQSWKYNVNFLGNSSAVNDESVLALIAPHG